MLEEIQKLYSPLGKLAIVSVSLKIKVPFLTSPVIVVFDSSSYKDSMNVDSFSEPIQEGPAL